MLYLLTAFYLLDIISYMIYNYKVNKINEIDEIDEILAEVQYKRINNITKNPIYIFINSILEQCL